MYGSEKVNNFELMNCLLIFFIVKPFDVEKKIVLKPFVVEKLCLFSGI